MLAQMFVAAPTMVLLALGFIRRRADGHWLAGIISGSLFLADALLLAWSLALPSQYHPSWGIACSGWLARAAVLSLSVFFVLAWSRFGRAARSASPARAGQ